MALYSRYGNRWTVNEYIQLQREFELLKLSISEIAKIHKRTPNAIMYKLEQEGFSDYNVLYSNHHDLNSTSPTKRTNKYDLENENQAQYKQYYIPENQEEEDEDDDKDDEDYIPENEDNDEDDDDKDDDEEYLGDDEQEYLGDDLKSHVMRLEKQVKTLTEMFMNQIKNKRVFSLFA